MPRTLRPLTAPGTPVARGRLHGDAFSYACSGRESLACRHSVTLVAALAEGCPLVQSAGGSAQGRLLLVAPMVERQLWAAGVPVLLLDLEPTHPRYRCFLPVAGAQGVCSLDHLGFDELSRVGRDMLGGALAGPALDQAMRAAVRSLAQRFAQPPELDDRVRWMMTELQNDPARSLSVLSDQLGLSVEYASRLFSSQLGLPLRVYALSCKIRLAARFMGAETSLTEVAQMAGFADSAHFAKVWTRCYGAPPSNYFPPRRMHMDDQGLPGWIQPPAF
jgi:AraC-like DNA-binding protein